MKSGKEKAAGIRWLIGIDEVGRGPLAGPVTLCACAVLKKDAKRIFNKNFKGLVDSKKISSKKRTLLSREAKDLKKKNLIKFAVSHVGADVIDRIGISHAIRRAVRSILKQLKLEPAKCEVRLDGSLYAPAEYVNQKTIIKGDATEPVISLASVIAKVARDTKMDRYSEVYSEYGFEVHKGYGTLRHIQAVIVHGACDIHRRSFLKNIVDK